MKYTSKVALLAIALFGTSAIAAPFAGEVEQDVEAREVDNELSAREFYDQYLEAREDPSLDARDLETLDLEAREYLEYLEAREAASVCLIRKEYHCFLLNIFLFAGFRSSDAYHPSDAYYSPDSLVGSFHSRVPRAQPHQRTPRAPFLHQAPETREALEEGPRH